MARKVIAFIPVRGGSKSIPLKNIKEFCGKPLVYWSTSALENAKHIDKIVIATDSEQIKETVLAFNFNKIEIFDRSKESATDTASTENVMIEYIDKANVSDSDLLILVQATSPLTQTKHIEEALSIYFNGKYDSMLTCVRNYRFFWNSDGTSKNYDYRNRPRRQDFSGELMENGAFYINTIDNIKKHRNRLSGKVGVYEMPEYTSFEIDEPDDWAILENLMYKYVLSKKLKKKIKLVLSDVDGVLTDGGMYYSQKGDELKKFNTRDGMGFQLLREAGIKTGIITSENTKIVDNRAKKLKVEYLFQGKREGGKLTAAIEICQKEGIELEEVAYIGDDINCIQVLSKVGLAACPKNASKKVKAIPNIIVLNSNGGEGVLRELVELILEN